MIRPCTGLAHRDRSQVILILGIYAALVGTSCYRTRHYEIDDAYIYYRCVDNLMNGQGLSFNPGSNLNSLASIVYAWLLIPGQILGILPLYGHLFNALLLFILSGLVLKLFVACGFSSATGFVGGLLIASYQPFARLNGLEMVLFLVVLVGLMIKFRTSTMLALGVAIAPFIRPEAVLLAPALCVLRVIDHVILGSRYSRSTIIKEVVVFSVIGAILSAVLLINFGTLVPQSVTAKLAQSKSDKWTGNLAFERQLSKVTTQGWMLIFVGLAFIGLGRSIATSTRSLPMQLALGYVFSIGVGYWLVGGPSYRWYYLPFELVELILATLGLETVVSNLLRLVNRRTYKSHLVLLTGLVLAFVLLMNLPHNAELFNQEQALFYRMIGEKLRQTPADTSVATAEVGIIGYYSKKNIVDFLGIVTQWPDKVIEERKLITQVETMRPDYVLVSPLELLGNYDLVELYEERGSALFKRKQEP